MDSHTLSSDYIFSIIHEIENNVPVKDWVVNGVYVWPLLRLQLRPIIFNMFGNNVTSPESSQSLKVKENLFVGRFAQVLIFFKELSKFPFRKVLKQHDAVLLSDGISLTYMDGAASDKFFRNIEDQLKDYGYNTLTVSPSKVLLTPLKSPIHNFSILEIGAQIGASLRIRFPFKRIDFEKYDTFIEIINRYKIPTQYFTYEKIFFRSYKIYLIERAFALFLKQVRPFMVMTISYYHDLGFAFNRACRKLGIPTVDIQHGTQGGVHDAYDHWRQIPSSGYPELPFVFWTWSKTDASVIEKWSSNTQDAHYTFVGGNPSLNCWFLDNDIVRNYDKRIESIKTKILKNQRAIDILVTLQPVKAFQAYWDVLAEVIQHDFDNVRWWIRNHPTTTFGNKQDGIGKILAIKRTNVETVHSSNFPLGALLRNMDLHLTVRSSTSLEAKAFGIRTLFISDIAKYEHPEFIKNGDGIIIEEKESIINYIKNVDPKKKIKKDAFKSDSIKSLLDLLRKLQSR